MAYYEFMQRMKNDPTDGSEFNNGKKFDEAERVLIGHTQCDYCGKEILAVWDKNVDKQYWPFLGNQARKPNTYKYSQIIQAMRKFYNVTGLVWDEEHGNNLVNVHARCHSSVSSNPKRWCDASIRLLCPSCFQKTYNRIKVIGTGADAGIEYALSVVESRGETIKSVMKDLGITGKIVGKGGIEDYE